MILDRELKQVTACDDSCGTNPMGGAEEVGYLSGFLGTTRHARWPRPWNQNMLDYLKAHPLPPPRPAF